LFARSIFASDLCVTVADKAIEKTRSWHELRVWFQKYPQCDDGYIAEGVSDSIVHWLATRWDTFPALRLELRKRPVFQRFILRHIDSTTDSDELNAILRNAHKRCPCGAATLCRTFISAAADALHEQQSFR
jgi:hypothetical protein